MPWTGLLGLIEPFYPKAGGGRKSYPLETMLRIHLLQNWFSLSEPAMEEALYVITPMRQFARLTLSAPIPEDTTIMNFRHLLEKHQLAPAILAVINGYLHEKGLYIKDPWPVGSRSAYSVPVESLKSVLSGSGVTIHP